MAIATFNPSYPPFRGKIGGLVFKHYRDKVVVTRAPSFSGQWSAAQRAGRQRFAEASAYARFAQADPMLRAKYLKVAKRRGLTLRSAAISAYLRGDVSSSRSATAPRRPAFSGSNRTKSPTISPVVRKRKQRRPLETRHIFRKRNEKKGILCPISYGIFTSTHGVRSAGILPRARASPAETIFAWPSASSPPRGKIER